MVQLTAQRCQHYAFYLFMYRARSNALHANRGGDTAFWSVAKWRQTVFGTMHIVYADKWPLLASIKVDWIGYSCDWARSAQEIGIKMLCRPSESGECMRAAGFFAVRTRCYQMEAKNSFPSGSRRKSRPKKRRWHTASNETNDKYESLNDLWMNIRNSCAPLLEHEWQEHFIVCAYAICV